MWNYEKLKKKKKQQQMESCILNEFFIIRCVRQEKTQGKPELCSSTGIFLLLSSSVSLFFFLHLFISFDEQVEYSQRWEDNVRFTVMGKGLAI